MMTKTITALLITFLFHYSSAQSKIQFEQIAFDYYKDSIIDGIDSKRVLKRTILDDHTYFDVDCLREFDFRIDDTATILETPYKLSRRIINKDKRFKHKGDKTATIVFATTSLMLAPDQILAAVVEEHSGHYTTHLIEMNTDGVTRRWCSGVISK